MKKVRNKKDLVCVGIDMGTASLAVLARQGADVIFSESLRLRHDTASLADPRKTRRMVRTRLAHCAREFWWNECAKAAGLPVLKTITRQADGRYEVGGMDDRLKREHPTKNDETVYAGSLLRIMILEGHIDKLEDWQIYKAIHSAMQQRGYDTEIPWKRGSRISGGASAVKNKQDKNGENDQDADDEQENTKSLSAFMEVVSQELPNKSHHYACYFEAQRSGLWNPKDGIVDLKQTSEARQHAVVDFLGYVAPRAWKERELKHLLQEIAKRFPQINPDYVLYGPALVSYGSHPAQKPKVKRAGGDLSLKLGKETDWQGLLSQKLPRFDNRAVNRCVVFPGMAVCRLPAIGGKLPKDDASDWREERLFPKFNMLAKLKNLRVIADGKVAPQPLSQEQVQAAVDHFSATLEATKTELKTFLKSQKLTLAPGHETDLKYKRGGRCAFSRPALRILSRWLYEGWTAEEAKERIAADFVKGNQDPTKGLTADDFQWVDRLPNDGYASSFYVPHTSEAVQQTPKQILGKIRHPVVRHRLGLLGKVLEKLQFRLAELDIPMERVRFGVEVIRDDSDLHSFAGEKSRKEIQKRNNERAKQNEAIRKQVEKHNLPYTAHDALKLMERQGGIDPYDISPDGIPRKIEIEGIAQRLYEVDHIVPRAQGGSDGLHNKVLTLSSLNGKKGGRTPYEWLHESPETWRNYVQTVAKMAKRKNGISKLTAQLLTAPNAADLDGKRSDLQATGYMERTAQAYIYAFFGLLPPQLGGARQVVFVPGAMTARYRRRYRLDSLLYDTRIRDEHGQVVPQKLTALKKSLKNRDNPLHHILDAAVVSFIPEWAKNPKKERQFEFPKFAVPAWFNQQVLQDHVPRWYNSERAKIGDTNYGLRIRDGKRVVTKRKKLPDSEVRAGDGQRAKRVRVYERFDPTRHLILPSGNVIKSAVHRGVIVWRDASKKIKKWNCHVVAAWSTIADARRALVSAHPDAQIETWNGGAMLEKGTIVELAAPVKDVLPQGRYVVAGAKSSGEIRFHGNDSTFSVSVLIETGQMRVVS